MSDLVGKTLDEAKSLFPSLNFNVPDGNYIFSDSYPKGTIIEQSVKKGDKINGDATVTLKISKGSETIETPDYVGKTLIYVKSDLDKKGIKYKIEEVQTNQAQEGTVVKTDPAAGFLIKVETQEITIFVAAKAKENTSLNNDKTSSEKTSNISNTTSVGVEPID
ncbi:MAG: PASTA domain-containing protein [Clostridia bacterium]